MILFERPEGYESDQELFDAIRRSGFVDNVHTLEFLTAFIDAHKTIPKQLVCRYKPSTYSDLKIQANKLHFFDPAFLDKDPIGTVRIDRTYEGVWIHVFSPFCNKVRSDIENGMRSDKTKDIKKAIKTAIKNFQPYDAFRLAQLTRIKAIYAIDSWMGDVATFSHVLRSSEHIEELQHLVDSGVTFKTDLYKQAVQELPKAAEYLRRGKVRGAEKVFLVEVRGSLVFGFGGDSKGAKTYSYSSVDELPEIVRQKYVLLKMVSDETHLPDVGYRDTGNIFWLFGIDALELKRELGVD